jgi:hypothetical protein
LRAADPERKRSETPTVASQQIGRNPGNLREEAQAQKRPMALLCILIRECNEHTASAR